MALYWGSANQGLLQKDIRVVSGATYNAHTLPLFKDSNIVALTD